MTCIGKNNRLEAIGKSLSKLETELVLTPYQHQTLEKLDKKFTTILVTAEAKCKATGGT
jgi:hypothetical protein